MMPPGEILKGVDTEVNGNSGRGSRRSRDAGGDQNARENQDEEETISSASGEQQRISKGQ